MKHASTNLMAFVIMPFGRTEEDRRVFNYCYDLFKHPLVQLGFEVTRSDQITSAQEIMTDIVLAIEMSNIVVADLTDCNPNVMYELGVSHTLRKPTIILTQNELGTLPFDTKHYRTIRYHPSQDYMQDACQQLQDLAHAYLANQDKFNNIVCRSLNYTMETFDEWTQKRTPENTHNNLVQQKQSTRTRKSRRSMTKEIAGGTGITAVSRLAGGFESEFLDSSQPDIIWRTDAGAEYGFEVKSIRGRFPSVGGVYIFASKLESEKLWKAIYIGYADNLDNVISTAQPQWSSASMFGATHVHYAIVHSSDAREHIASALIASLRPIMNSWG